MSGPVELAALLRQRHAADFRRSLVEKLLVYALGRPLTVGDRRAVRAILAESFARVIEVHSLKPLLGAATSRGRPVPLAAAGGGEGGRPWRQRLTLPVGETVVLTFLEGMIGPGQSSDDFLKAVAEVPLSDMSRVVEIARTSHAWNASLTGPDNVRPGTVLAIEFDVSLVAKPSDTVELWIATPGGTNDSMVTNSGGFRVDGEGTHRLRQVGLRRTTTHDGWNDNLTAVIQTRPQTLVGNVSPIRVVRPRLGLDGNREIQLGPVGPDEAAASGELRIFNAQATTVDDQRGDAVASILYGCCRMWVDPKFAYKVTMEHVGCELVGPDAKAFELVGDHAAEDGQTLSLIGDDGEPGLAGGPDPEQETLRVRFRGRPEPGRYTAAVRIVTQAGNLGSPSPGGPEHPLPGLSFIDLPVEAIVEPSSQP